MFDFHLRDNLNIPKESKLNGSFQFGSSPDPPQLGNPMYRDDFRGEAINEWRLCVEPVGHSPLNEDSYFNDYDMRI
jgi:hypothetical protein